MGEIYRKSVDVGGVKMTFETGRVAKQASGAVWLTANDTTILVTAQGAKEARPGMNFLPLTVDYQEKTAAGGKIPGGFFKREGRPREEETLTSRIIDRSIRPLFEDGWDVETQVIATVLSADSSAPPNEYALTGASVALCLSDLPFQGPIAGLRVCRIDGKFVLNPPVDEREKADINIMMAASRDAIVMVEGGADQADEQAMIDALLFGHEASQPIIDAQEELMKQVGKEKRHATPAEVDQALKAKVTDLALPKIKEAYNVKEKLPRYAALDAAKAEVVSALVEADESLAERKDEISEIIGGIKYDYVRGRIIKDKHRIDGRGLTDIRPINTEVGILPRTHGSALFTRGETQGIVTCTVGTRQDEQRIDGLFGDTFNRFMLHYNFPPYSVGEVKFLRSPGRREIGHGALADRAIRSLIDFEDESFPYTVRLVSDITESNGSSSMATVCGSSMALMDAGIPTKGACAGIAMGLIKEGDDIAILSDILGDEDHLGDMDFKVAGTEKGITAIQMDIKIKGVSREILENALEQARQGRLHIIGEMNKTLNVSREEMSQHAPRITSFRIKVDRIRDVIGPGGKVIKDIVARTGCQVNVEDDGLVSVASSDGEASKQAIKMIEDLTQEAEMGKLYLGNVRKITDFGAFVEIFPGTDGLVHISELANKRVKRVEDVLQEGDEVMVKVIGLEKGKIRLSRKEALKDAEEAQAQG